MQNNILSFIGLARKSGSLELGADKSYDLIETGKTKLVLFAKDVAENTETSIRNCCVYKETPVIKTEFTKVELGSAVGMLQCGVISVTNTGFAHSLAQKMEKKDLEELLKAKMEREKKRLQKKQMKKQKSK